MEQLTNIRDNARAHFYIDHVAYEGTAKASSQFGSVIANLIGVREHDGLGLNRFQKLFESGSIAIGRVLGEQRMIGRVDFFDGISGGFFGERGDICTQDDG